MVHTRHSPSALHVVAGVHTFVCSGSDSTCTCITDQTLRQITLYIRQCGKRARTTMMELASLRIAAPVYCSWVVPGLFASAFT